MATTELEAPGGCRGRVGPGTEARRERVGPQIAQMGVDGVVIDPMGPSVRRVFRLAELAG